MTRVYTSESITFKDYLTRTFLMTGLGIGISALSAFGFYFFGLYRILYTVPFTSMLLIVAQLGSAMYFSFRLNTMSKQTALFCYGLYSVLTGVSLWSIAAMYTAESIVFAFVSTCVLFVCMAIIGHTTRVDLTRFTGLLLSGLMTIIIVSFINALFIHSSTTTLLISYLAVVVFLGLIAYDIQNLRMYYRQGMYLDEMEEKMVIYGAFQLYLDFINLFIRIIQIFGKRKDN